MTTAPARLEQAAEHLVRPGDVAAGERPADRRAADRLVHTVGPLDEGKRLDLEVVLDTQLAQQHDVAVAVTTEVEVVTDDDHLGVEAADEDALDELLGRLVRLMGVERHDDHGIDPGRLEQLHLLRVGRQQSRCRLRPDHGGRMAIERDHGRQCSQFGGDARGRVR